MHETLGVLFTDNAVASWLMDLRLEAATQIDLLRNVVDASRVAYWSGSWHVTKSEKKMHHVSTFHIHVFVYLILCCFKHSMKWIQCFIEKELNLWLLRFSAVFKKAYKGLFWVYERIQQTLNFVQFCGNSHIVPWPVPLWLHLVN